MFKRILPLIFSRARAIRALAFAGAAMAVLGASPAMAVSPATTDVVKPETLIQKVHGCHRSCEFGYIPRWGVTRWHRHAGPGCYPVRCAPRAVYPHRCWVDWRGVRHCRW